MPDLRVSRRVLCLSPRLLCVLHRVFGLFRLVLCSVGCVLPNQMRVRKSRRREIRSVGCILPRMFPVREDEIVAFQHAQSQSGEGICHPFRSINLISAVDDLGVFVSLFRFTDFIVSDRI